jgi:predicted NBD/HSP70 family sugar kinase
LGLSPRTGSLESLREHNLLRVIDVLLEQGVASRADIARTTGLSRTTVSSLVGDLVERGLVVERAEGDDIHQRDSGAGRPPVLLALDRSAGAAIGIDFGHSHLRVAVADLSHEILAEEVRVLDVDASAADGLVAASEMVDAVLEEANVPRDRVINVGMGVPGPISHTTGNVGNGAILPGWVGVSPAFEMERRLGLPVVVDNDANLGALGEALFGAGRGAREIVYLKVSSGIGAGLIVGGRIHHGAGGTAGELGHVLVDEEGHVCRCGNRGCLETVASTTGLLEQLSRTHGTGLTIEDVVRLASGDDPGCRRRGPAHGPGAGHVVQPAQPGADHRRRRPRRRRGSAARPAARLAEALCDPLGGGGRRGGHGRAGRAGGGTRGDSPRHRRGGPPPDASNGRTGRPRDLRRSPSS